MGQCGASKVPPVGGWHVILCPEHQQEQPPSTERGVAPQVLLDVAPRQKLELRPDEAEVRPGFS